MRRYRARIASDTIRRAQYLVKHRLWRQRKASTKYDTRPGYRKEAAIQLKNESNVKFPDPYKQNEKPADQSSLNTEIVEIFYDKSIPEDLKAELYWIVLRRYHNDMSDEDSVEANPVEPALPPPTPPPASPSMQLLASAESKRCCHKQRESPSSAPLVLAAAKSGCRQRRQKSPPSSLPRQSKHDRRKSIVWEAYW